MKSLRQAVAITFALVMVAGRGTMLHAAEAADSAAAAPATPVAQGPSWSLEGTGSYHSVDHPYFGAGDRRNGWGEGFSRLRVNCGRPDGLWFSAGGVGMGTAGRDYYGVHDLGDGRIDQLLAGAVNVAGSGVSVVAGRQDLVLGDGFLIGDGYRDTRTALWNIPLNFYDALRVDWTKGAAHALAFGANLSRSFGGDGAYPKGEIVGGELGYAPAEGSDLTVAYLQRLDDGDTGLDATAYSLRGSWVRGPATIAGEAVLESGKQAGVTANGRGGHVRFELAGRGCCAPVGKLEYFLFSGDDPATPENEAYDPWQYRWSDWSQYYVGDLLASTVLTSSNMRIVRAQLGLTPREGTGVRLLVHRFDRDRATEASPSKAFAYEYDLVVDQAFGEHWSAWVMGGYASPLDAAKAEFGMARSGQLFASVSWKFGGPGGGAE